VHAFAVAKRFATRRMINTFFHWEAVELENNQEEENLIDVRTALCQAQDSDFRLPVVIVNYATIFNDVLNILECRELNY
jgi:hypothetical protein